MDCCSLGVRDARAVGGALPGGEAGRGEGPSSSGSRHQKRQHGVSLRQHTATGNYTLLPLACMDFSHNILSRRGARASGS